MPNYDFHNCFSPREFEEFVQDVLEIKEQIPFEISGRGKDGGIDLRYWEGETKIIVQVKCYQNNYRQLLSVLRSQEKQKAIVLNPSRYILVVSFTLELKQKDEIFQLFEGIIKNREDIIDSNDLNKLLRNDKYHSVERAHYKLWISSTNILTNLIENVVHRGILTESKIELEAIKKTIPIFVQNPSFVRALDILHKSRYILISGEPGIGKTTLGRCLSAYYLQHLNYKEFIYTEKVSSALDMYKEEEKQIFFFDDFWGDIFKDEKLPHNEEKRLLRFIQLISESNNKILILTSREYVLQQGFAKYHNKQLEVSLNIGKCFLQLEDYSDLIKAKILFNHLYYADKLTWDYVEAIVNGYERIINHKNYHPRLIENFLIQGPSLMDDNDTREFYNKFIDYLNDPYEFWKETFMKLTYGARLTSIILFLSSQPIRLSELKESLYSCIEVGRQNNIYIQEEEFESIIAQLEKTVITTQSMERTLNILVRFQEPFIVVKFQNSSIKEFFYRYLVENIHQYGKILIQGCPFINQLLSMFKTTELRRYIYEGLDEDALDNREKVLLPPSVELLLINRIIDEFDLLEYSYVEEDVFEPNPSIHMSLEDYKVRKLNDIVFSLGINENIEVNTFIINKVKSFCTILHEEEYPFSYNDMIEFPYLIKAVQSLNIDIDYNILIKDYYSRCRFAEHLLSIRIFKEISPKEYSNFMKENYKQIKREIKYVLLDDIDYFTFDAEYERIDYLLDIVYPQILDQYKLHDSKKFWKDIEMVTGYDSSLEDEAITKDKEEKNRKRDEEIRIQKEVEKKTEESIKIEQEALLGVQEELSDEEIVEFINRSLSDIKETQELIHAFKNESPWYVWPFFSNWNRVSLLVDFYQEEKNLPLTSALFYEKLEIYLIKKFHAEIAFDNIDSLIEMFSEFALDMMEEGETIFSEHNIKNHPAFRYKLETEEISSDILLSFPFLIQRGKWYEFRTLALQIYFSLKKFIIEYGREQIADFLDLNGCFVYHVHDIWLLCSELDIQAFNQFYVIPLLKEYLHSIDETNHYTVCSSTLRFLQLKVNFEISLDKPFLEVSGSEYVGEHIELLNFLNKDLLEFELYMSDLEDRQKNIENKNLDLLRLYNFILEKGSKYFRDDEYSLDLYKNSRDLELLDILNSLGICNYLWKFYKEVEEMVEKIEASDYNIRLDKYLHDPVKYVYTSEK